MHILCVVTDAWDFHSMMIRIIFDRRKIGRFASGVMSASDRRHVEFCASALFSAASRVSIAGCDAIVRSLGDRLSAVHSVRGAAWSALLASSAQAALAQMNTIFFSQQLCTIVIMIIAASKPVLFELELSDNNLDGHKS